VEQSCVRASQLTQTPTKSAISSIRFEKRITGNAVVFLYRAEEYSVKASTRRDNSVFATLRGFLSQSAAVELHLQKYWSPTLMTKEGLEVLVERAISESGLPLSAQVSTESADVFDVWFSGKNPRELKVAIDTNLFNTDEAVSRELKLKLRIHYSLMPSGQDAAPSTLESPGNP
jgi:hypothetical protein